MDQSGSNIHSYHWNVLDKNRIKKQCMEASYFLTLVLAKNPIQLHHLKQTINSKLEQKHCNSLEQVFWISSQRLTVLRTVFLGTGQFSMFD